MTGDFTWGLRLFAALWAVWVGGLIFLGYEHKNWPFVAKSGHAARRSILQVGDFQTAHWAIFVSTGRLEPQTAQWGVWSVQVGSSVVRIPNYVRNFWIWILAGVVTFPIFCSKIPFISVSYWRRWAPAGSKNKRTAHFSSKIRPDRLRGGKRNKKKEARVIFSGGFLEPPTTNRPQGCEWS